MTDSEDLVDPGEPGEPPKPHRTCRQCDRPNEVRWGMGVWLEMMHCSDECRSAHEVRRALSEGYVDPFYRKYNIHPDEFRILKRVSDGGGVGMDDLDAVTWLRQLGFLEMTNKGIAVTSAGRNILDAYHHRAGEL